MDKRLTASANPVGEIEERDIDMSWLDPTSDFKVFAIMQIWGMVSSFVYYPKHVYDTLIKAVIDVCNDQKSIDEKYNTMMDIIESNDPDSELFNTLFDKLYGAQDIRFRDVYDKLMDNPGESMRRSVTLQGTPSVFRMPGLIAAASTSRLARRGSIAFGKVAAKEPITITRSFMSKQEEVELRFLAKPADKFLKNFILRKWSIYQESSFGTLHFDAISRFIIRNTIPSVESAPQADSLAQLPINQINAALFSGLLTVAEVTAGVIGTREIADAQLCRAVGAECVIPETAVAELRRDIEFQENYVDSLDEYRRSVIGKTIEDVRKTRGKKGGSHIKRRSSRKRNSRRRK